MSTEELVFTLVIFAASLFYIYKKLFKKSSCGGSCGCSSQTKQRKQKG